MPALKLDLEIDVDVSICKEGLEILVFDNADDVIAQKIVPWDKLENYPFEYSRIPLMNRDVFVNAGYDNTAQELNDLICKMEESAKRMRKRLEESSIFFRDKWVNETETDNTITDQAFDNEKYTKPFSYDMVNQND